ncbi:uncharacterized protein LOC115674473 [Syzygium oleosum]|uniref:uncharacterized protein LOC115674473 n=1 Tax=Syzygium oleosum TaxID=219896 RepID=UPI0011D1CA2C|nr:uncharacterized protein LOC115674473 [Syzygium oleosum]
MLLLLLHKLVEQFLKLKPSKFGGTGDPEAATLWVKELEKAFALLRCSEEDKATRGRIFPEGTVPSWDAFVEVFNGKYFSECAREQKMAEFLRLRQNHLLVDQYEAESAKQSKYAPRMTKDPVDRARRFRDGLKLEIRSQLVPLNLKDYNELYENAQLIERDMVERATASGSWYAPSRGNHWFKKEPMTRGKHHIPPNRKNDIGKPAYNPSNVCRFCGRRHGNSPCPSRTGACYGCGQHGHQVRDCSN